ncbi:hypothetical protein LTR37_019269 [Vermiconidia calcicola]|uniref:Uncharacterized protein n=1 Tax=Vermiconidia calcicola TaxID=1690605 RepID=A0ACC3MGE0_9PEZI|nr:hypothetical protein LTR37_019269 [Vermiconidia calcicola]
MGLMDKITGHNQDQSKLEKQNHDSSSTGYAPPTGTAVDSSREGYGSQNTTSGTGYGTGNDQYGAYTDKHGDSTASRMPGGFDDDHTGGTSSGTASGAHQPMNPYSSKGQQAAADASSRNYSRPSGEDPNSRSTHEGIREQTADHRYPYGSDSPGTTTGNHSSRDQPTSSAPQHIQQSGQHNYGREGPTSGGQYDTQSSSQHNYGRDAAMAGGAGAGGVGAYELGKQHHSQPDQKHSGAYTQTGSSHAPELPYRSAGGAQHGSDDRYGTSDRHMGGGTGPSAGHLGASSMGRSSRDKSPGSIQARKQGEAYERGYEAGYRDAMEHYQESGNSGHGHTGYGNTGYDTHSSNNKPSMMDKLNPKKDTDRNAGYGNTGSGYDNNRAAYGNTGSGYDNTRSSYDNTHSGYDNNSSNTKPSMMDKLNPKKDTDRDAGYDNTRSGYDNTGSGYDNTGSGYDNTRSGYDNTSSNTKPSMMDKLNPKKDANNDGKPGFMK